MRPGTTRRRSYRHTTMHQPIEARARHSVPLADRPRSSSMTSISAKPRCRAMSTILPSLALQVGHELGLRRLAHIDDGLAVQERSWDQIRAGHHRTPRRPDRRPAASASRRVRSRSGIFGLKEAGLPAVCVEARHISLVSGRPERQSDGGHHQGRERPQFAICCRDQSCLPPSRQLNMPVRKVPASPELKPRLRHLNETLFFGLDHARTTIAEWADDYNRSRPHSALGYITPETYAANLTATDDRLRNPYQVRRSSVAYSAPYGVSLTAEALITAG